MPKCGENVPLLYADFLGYNMSTDALLACEINDGENCDLENILGCSGQEYFTVVIEKYLRHAKEHNEKINLAFLWESRNVAFALF